jgi:hypothetical protein
LTGGKANKAFPFKLIRKQRRLAEAHKAPFRAACAQALWFINLTCVKTQTTAATSLVNDAMVQSSDLFVD